MKKVLRVLLYGFLLLIVLVFLLPSIGLGGTRVIGTLLFGWVSFLRRVLPEISVSWSGIGMGLVCSGLIVAGTHWLCSWIYAHNQTDPEKQSCWKGQWSTSLYAGLWLLFLSTMGITGFVHQVGWLANSKEPIMVARLRPQFELHDAAMRISAAAANSDWDLEETRKEFFAEREQLSSRRRPIVEKLHVLFLPGKDSKLAAVVIFPRDLVTQEKTGFMLVLDRSDNGREEHAMRELPEVLARFGRR